MSDRRTWIAICLLSMAASNLASAQTIVDAGCREPGDSSQLFADRLLEVLPPDAATYIQAALACEHWYGEEGYDAQRQQQIQAGIDKDCAGVQRQLKQIHARYRAQPVLMGKIESILDAVGSGDDGFVWDDQGKHSGALNRYFNAQACYVAASINYMLQQKDYARLPAWTEDVNKLVPELPRLQPATRASFGKARQAFKQALRAQR